MPQTRQAAVLRPPLCKDLAGTSPNGETRDANREQADQGGGGPVYLCRACRSVAARPRDRIAVMGRDRHVFFNPHGLVFEILCLAAAPGCRLVGPATGEFSWFPGYAWRAALCGACGAHLGWGYLGEERVFYGLIEAALVEEERGA